MKGVERGVEGEESERDGNGDGMDEERGEGKAVANVW